MCGQILYTNLVPITVLLQLSKIQLFLNHSNFSTTDIFYNKNDRRTLLHTHTTQ